MSLFNFFKNLFVKDHFDDNTSKKLFDHYFFDLKYYLHQDASVGNFAHLLNITTDRVSQISTTYYHYSFQVLVNEYRCEHLMLELEHPMNAGLSMESIVKLSGFESIEKYSEYLKGNMNQIKSSIKVVAIVLVMMASASKVQSQVSIGVPLPASSAMLDVSSTTKGFLPPRMSEIQRVLILKPDAGLIVYQTDGKKGLYFYDGSSWNYVMNHVNTITPNETVIAIGGGVGDNISTYGTVKAPTPTFATSEWMNVGGFAVYLKNKRKIYNNDFDGTQDLTKDLVSDGITSRGGSGRGFLAVGGATTLSGTLTVGGLATTNIGLTNNGTLTNNGRLTNIGNATITGTLLVSTVSPTSTAAVLELSSTTQGFLPPRMTTTQRDAITNKVEGLTIWNKTNKQLEVYDGSHWFNMNGNLVSILSVGDAYGGGIVAYIFVPGDIGYVAGQTHGLIAAISDQTTDAGVKWFPGIFYDVTQTFLGQGLANTISIIASSGTASLTNYAAGLASSFRGGGYSDWYLPSKDELAKLYQNRAAIGNFATSGLAAYWSSSQKGSFNFKDFVEYAKGISSAWVQLFFESGGEGSGTIKDLGISNLRRVRAVRFF